MSRSFVERGAVSSQFSNGMSPKPQHVLLVGFQIIRHLGFLCPNETIAIEVVRRLMTLPNGAVSILLAAANVEPVAKPAPRCLACGALM